METQKSGKPPPLSEDLKKGGKPPFCYLTGGSMRIYYIKDSYIDYLRQYDNKVAENKHETRPYVGVVVECDGIKYYAPLSSPKQKHLSMKNAKDFRKIAGGKYGAINFINMIPVVDSALILIDFKTINDVKYRRLLQNQYKAIRSDSDQIKKTASNLRSLLVKADSELSDYELKIKKRCCNIELLEQIFTEFNNI